MKLLPTDIFDVGFLKRHYIYYFKLWNQPFCVLWKLLYCNNVCYVFDVPKPTEMKRDISHEMSCFVTYEIRNNLLCYECGEMIISTIKSTISIPSILRTENAKNPDFTNNYTFQQVSKSSPKIIFSNGCTHFTFNVNK